MKVGICGGTFDPFHRGHLDPVLAVRDTMQWQRVIYVPAATQPFKRDRQNESGYHRFAMAALATQQQEGVLVSPLELERSGISYSVDTLRDLRASMPDATLDWIIGDDNASTLLEWKSIETIFELANFVVLARRGSAALATLPEQLRDRVCQPRGRPDSGAIVLARNDLVPVSSTEVRRRLRAGEPVDELVSASVSRYIDRYALYRKA